MNFYIPQSDRRGHGRRHPTLVGPISGPIHMDVSIDMQWIDPECRSSVCLCRFPVFNWIVYIIQLDDEWAWSMWIYFTDPHGLIQNKPVDDVLVRSMLDHVRQPYLDWSIRVSGSIFLDRSTQFIGISCVDVHF